MENITLNVKGMSCQHCVKAVEGSVGQLQGVKKVSVKLDKGLVDVEFDSKILSLGTIKETIDDQGYDVE
jgi:copper chaperone